MHNYGAMSSRDSLQQFQDLLRRLFQFDGADMDFGIYRILNYKREQIEQFITQRLPEIVDEAFAKYTAAEIESVEQEIEQKKFEITKSSEALGLQAFDESGQLSIALRDTPMGRQYLDAVKRKEQYQVSDDLKTRVYNDLYNFFARYYEDGDFISKRRYGRNEAYAVPYNGEEVMLHWATKDQYYIKTGERFKNYRFTGNGYTVVFELRNASTEQNNNRGEKRYFVLASEQPVVWDDSARTLTCCFEYRPLTENEQKTYGSTEQQKPQEKLNEEAAPKILEHVLDPTLKALLQQSERYGEPPRLLKHLTRFTRRNTSDFFIHKDLRGFLQRELEFYIKSECLRLDELLNAPNAELAQQHLQRGRVMREIGNHIIDFLAQIEEFQKKLFEKKKFVLSTDYCITIGQIPERFWDEILQNEAQLNEWRELYALEELMQQGGLFGSEINRDFLRQHPTLVVDTRHFSEEFKWRLLEAFDHLDDAIDGVLIHSENFQALNLLLEKYRERVKCIYIDPPYNTDASPIIYKNDYKSSSWLSMMDNRLFLAREFLSHDGMMGVAIDDFELRKLLFVIESHFGKENLVATVVVRSNPSGRPGSKGLSTAHEYMILVSKRPDISVAEFPRPERLDQRYKYKDEKGPYMWELLRKRGSGSEKKDSPKLYYPLYVSGDSIRLPKMVWDETSREWIVQESPEVDEVIVYPIDENGIHRRWRWSVETVEENLNDLRAVKDDKGVITIYYKYRPPSGMTPTTLWIDARYSATEHGTNVLKSFFKEYNPFSFPKSIYTVCDALTIMGLRSNEEIVLDFFAGSGTTGHAVINLNRADGGRRKFILVEMGDYFDSVLVARLKKVIFAPEWKDGKPKRPPTQEEIARTPRILKILRLESYEDALNNLELRREREGQQAFKTFGDEYLLRYMLEFETQGSPSLLDLEQFQHPFDYKLKVYQGDALETHPVDLVETFNYLLGIEVKRMRAFEHAGRLYRAVLGEKHGRRIAIVWRPLEGLVDDEAALRADAEYIQSALLPALLGEGVRPDQLYVNGVCTVEDAEPIEPEFKRLMFGGSGL